MHVACGAAFALRHLRRIDQQHGAAAGLQPRQEREPIDARGGQRDGRDAPVVRQAARAATSPVEAPKPRTGWRSSLGGTAPKGPSAPRSIPAACRVTAASGGGRGGVDWDVCGWRWAMAASTMPKSAKRQRAREERDGSTLPNGIRGLPVTSGGADVYGGPGGCSADPGHGPLRCLAYGGLGFTPRHGGREADG